jgi:phosphopentomutase
VSGRRAAVVVLDACGAGALPDADLYGDAGTDTLGHLAEAVGGLDLPVMGRLGLGSIIPLAGVPPAEEPVVHGRLHPLGPGKDTTAGHWELMGVVAPKRPVYPEGFPPEVVERLAAAWGRGVLCNRPSNGITVLEEYGPEHLRTGDLIVYTSQDSVLQIAAHEAVVSADELYAACFAAREVMRGEHEIGRVIARPFRGEPGTFERTEGRRDYALRPPARSYLEEVEAAGLPVHAVGKVAQVFSQVGITREHPGATNAKAIAATTALLRDLDAGLVFTNLVETDQVYGHRNDVEGFHTALREIDAAVGEWLALMRPGDMLVLTADHGCDPTTPGTDHTREHAPLLAVFEGHGGRRHDGPLADVGASVLRWLTGAQAPLPGTSFVA